MVNIKNVGLISKSITERQKKKKKRNIKFLKKKCDTIEIVTQMILC